jgi:hypothetical protein
MFKSLSEAAFTSTYNWREMPHEMRNEIQIVKLEIKVEGRFAGSRQEKMISLAFGIGANHDVRNNEWHHCSRD